MKLLQLIPIIAILSIASIAEAEEISYVGKLKGVECTACKKKIAQSLSKIKGVQTVRIAKGVGKSHRLEVTTDGSKVITKADAVKALKISDHYQVVSWSKSNR